MTDLYIKFMATHYKIFGTFAGILKPNIIW